MTQADLFEKKLIMHPEHVTGKVIYEMNMRDEFEMEALSLDAPATIPMGGIESYNGHALDFVFRDRWFA